METAIPFRTSLARAIDALVARRRAAPSGSAIQGQLLRLSERRETAIYLRHGTLWVADFIDGRGEIVEAASWFRFNCGVPGATWSRRRMLLESALPLSWELVARIEELHCPDISRPSIVVGQEESHGPIF
jgi:hypothetical protein